MAHALHEILEIKEQRFALGEKIRGLYRDDKGAKRSPTAEEDAAIDKMIAESEELRKRVERMERADGLLKDVAGTGGRSAVTDPEEGEGKEKRGDAGGEADFTEAARAVEAIFRSIQSQTPARRELRRLTSKSVRDTKEYRELFDQYCGGEADARDLANRAKQLRVEKRDLQVDNELQAGVLVPPQQFVLELLQDLDDATFLRTWARTFTMPQAKSLGAVKRTTKASTWIWGTELQTPSVDTSLAFGLRELHPRHATGEIKVSRPWLRAALLGPEQIVRNEIARDGAELMENAFLTGSGAGRPLGVFTADANGISTARDVSTGNTATEVTMTGLIEAKYAIKAAYWPRLRWLGSRTFHKQLYSLEDGDGKPLLVEGRKAGELDTALSFPVFINEFAPSTFTTGQYVGILGDWSYYWIADALDMELQRLDELYARSNQVGFIARLQTDGMPVLEECWSRVKLG